MFNFSTSYYKKFITNILVVVYNERDRRDFFKETYNHISNSIGLHYVLTSKLENSIEAYIVNNHWGYVPNFRGNLEHHGVLLLPTSCNRHVKWIYKRNIHFHVLETLAWNVMINFVAKIGVDDFHGMFYKPIFFVMR